MNHEKLRRHIIKRLYSKKAYVKGHVLGERLQRGVPAHLRGEAKQVLQQLVKEELIIIYGPTTHGFAYQLNIERMDDIEKEIFGENNKR